MENENMFSEFESSTKIATDVIAKIAAIAALEVEGVSAMGNNITAEILGKVGMKNLVKNVKVEYVNSKLRIDLAVTLNYGINIPGISQAVQAKVKQSVENMTGLAVSDVNVRIAGIDLDNND